jgi:hypothetical protein
MDYRLEAETGVVNFSPSGFRHAARDFLHSFETWKPPKFSLVPYFLCCRSIELAVKATHLETTTQKQVKDLYSHKLGAAYRALPASEQRLTVDDLAVLDKASALYAAKAFEYIQPGDAATAYSRFPDLGDLARVARALVR